MNPITDDADTLRAATHLTRAERRRLARGAYQGSAGIMVCKFCQSTKGTYVKARNRFVCQTEGCKGAANV